MRNFIIVISTLLFLTSCKEEKELSANISRSSNPEQSEIETFHFPDTVTRNTMIKGNLKYDRNFGNVDDSEIKERFIFFHVGTDSDSEDVALQDFDRFPYRLAFEDTIGDGLIEFETVFTELGINYLHGVVKDMYEIEGSGNNKDSVKVSLKETVVTKKVVVLEE